MATFVIVILARTGVTGVIVDPKSIKLRPNGDTYPVKLVDYH